MPNEIKITVKKIDTDPLEKVGDAGKKAGKDVGDGLEKGLQQGEQATVRLRDQFGRFSKTVAADAAKAGHAIEQEVGAGLDKTQSHFDKIKAKAKESGQAAGKAAGEGISGGLKDVLAGGNIQDALGGVLDNIKGAGGPAIAAGVGLGVLLMQGMSQQFEQQKIGGLLAAQTGAVSGAASQLGETAGAVFGDNFGDSLEDVRAAMKAVFDNKLIDKGAAQSDIKAVTESVMTAAQVVEEEVGRVAQAAQQLVRTGLANSVTEALDMITHAQQEGLNASEDLLDTSIEYGTLFRELGLSGAQAFGLIAQSTEAGARNTDIAADALKEFGIRARDGSEAAARGFREIGLDAEIMGGQIAAGGNTARDALARTLDQLRAIEDPLIRDQAAVDLFGTQAEDLADALFAMDLDTAGAKFGEFAGATKDAADTIAENTPAIETAWRNLQSGLNNTLNWATQSDAIDETLAKAREYGDKASESQDEYRERVDAASNAWRDQGGSIAKVTETLDEYISKQQEAATGVIDLSQAQIGYQKALDDATASAKEHKKNLDISTEGGRANQEALNDLADQTYDVIEAMEQQGATARDITNFMGGARDSFIATAMSMGLSRDHAIALADKLRLIPGDYVARVHTPGAAESNNIVRTLRGNLIDLTNRDWVASVSVTGTGALGGGRYFRAHGGPVGSAHAAEGGPRANQVWVGEQGPELVDLAPGSMVHTAGDSARMAAGWGGGGAVYLVPHLGSGADQAAGVFVSKLLRDGYLTLRTVDGVEVRVG